MLKLNRLTSFTVQTKFERKCTSSTKLCQNLRGGYGKRGGSKLINGVNPEKTEPRPTKVFFFFFVSIVIHLLLFFTLVLSCRPPAPWPAPTSSILVSSFSLPANFNCSSCLGLKKEIVSVSVSVAASVIFSAKCQLPHALLRRSYLTAQSEQRQIQPATNC